MFQVHLELSAASTGRPMLQCRDRGQPCLAKRDQTTEVELIGLRRLWDLGYHSEDTCTFFPVTAFFRRVRTPVVAYKRTVFLTSICLLLASGAAWSLNVNLSQFIVNDVELGGSVSGHTYLEYDCRASEQFSGFIWCHNRRMERTRIGTVVISNSILHDGDGKVAYVGQHIVPVIFGPGEIEKTVSLISAKYGEAARVMHPSSPWGIDRNAVIAIWGQINLEPLDSSTLSIIASGHDVKSGLRVDYLGDFRKSAKLGMPVYRIAGGPGYLWNASYDRNGRGHLRFLTSNAAAYAVPMVPNKKPTQTEEATRQNDVSSSPKLVPQSDVREINLAQRFHRPPSDIADSELPFSLPITSSIPNVGYSQNYRTVIKRTDGDDPKRDGDDPKRIAYNKWDTDEINQGSTKVVAQGSFHWAAAITIVVCGIVCSFALSQLFLGLGVTGKVIEYLNRRRNQRGQTQSDDGRWNRVNNNYASHHEYKNNRRCSAEEYCGVDYDGYNGSDREPWYEVLDVSAQASAEEIKRAWHDKVQKNHPDRVADLDLEFKVLADQRTKKLNNARDQGLSNLS
jgi:hypothetical protein